MTNVESAAQPGTATRSARRSAPTAWEQSWGSFLGSPFLPPAVYIGHPGWKQAGGRIGHPGNGIVVAVVCMTGLVGTFLAVFPMQSLVPVLLFIGLVIGAQAFNVNSRRYAPAIVLTSAQPRRMGRRPDRQRPGQCRHQRR